MRIEYEPKAIKDHKGLTSTVRAAILGKIVQYAQDQASLANNVIRLVGSPFFRLRVGDYRVIFSLDDDVATVMTVVRVSHRREAYD